LIYSWKIDFKIKHPYIIIYHIIKGANAVHGLMAGYTQFSVGHVCGKLAYLPIEELLDT